MAGESIGLGSVLEVEDLPGPPIQYIPVGGISDQLPVPGVSRSAVEVTAVDSAVQEWIAGIRGTAARTFKLFLRKGTTSPNFAAGQQRMEALARSGAIVSFRIVFPAALGDIKYECKGFVSEWAIELAHDQAVSASCTIQFSGDWVKSV